MFCLYFKWSLARVSLQREIPHKTYYFSTFIRTLRLGIFLIPFLVKCFKNSNSLFHTVLYQWRFSRYFSLSIFLCVTFKRFKLNFRRLASYLKLCNAELNSLTVASEDVIPCNKQWSNACHENRHEWAESAFVFHSNKVSL